ncbi:unnamed protein product [Caenorhabditis sp. 36 PRJEB53466]|nr:unnamed protein product [Caenorhabditis sp. 36 PRJEB53466]
MERFFGDKIVYGEEMMQSDTGATMQLKTLGGEAVVFNIRYGGFWDFEDRTIIPFKIPGEVTIQIEIHDDGIETTFDGVYILFFPHRLVFANDQVLLITGDVEVPYIAFDGTDQPNTNGTDQPTHAEEYEDGEQLDDEGEDGESEQQPQVYEN